MNPTIEIQYRNINREIIEDFKTHIDKSVSLRVYADQEDIDHFEAPADIVIYVNEHLTELIIGGLLVNAVWDGIKYAIKSIWEKVAKRKKNRNRIDLSFKIGPDKVIKYDLNGDVDPKNIGVLTENIFNYLKDREQQKKDFDNPDFKGDDIKPRIRMRYNLKTKNWEPVNFTKIKRKNEELLRQIGKHFDS